MKRSHEYDSPVLSRIVSIVTIFAICVCCVCACLTTYRMSSLTAGTAAPAQQQPAQQQPSNSGNTNTNTNTTPAPGGDTTPAPGGDSSQPGDATPAGADPAEVLAKYTEVMDKLKTCSKYTKKEFQQLPEDKRDLGTIGNIIMPIAEGFLTSEDKADTQMREGGEDAHNNIPVLKNNKGCLLTDTAAIKSCSMKEDGANTTIEIVLNAEENPQPAEADAATAPSWHGAMFSPLSKADIDEKLAGISAVKVNSFNLTYDDCKVTLTFNTETLEVVDFLQIMNVNITANVKALIVTIDGYAMLVNTMHIWDVQY